MHLPLEASQLWPEAHRHSVVYQAPKQVCGLLFQYMHPSTLPFLRALSKRNNSSYDPAIPLLGIHTKETRNERDKCPPLCIATLFTIARTWKQPRCLSADEWIRKLWHIYAMECYSAVKKNTFESVLRRWMKLEPIIQNEISQKEKHQKSILINCIFNIQYIYKINTYIWNLERW